MMFTGVLKEIATFLVLAVVIVLPIRFFIAQPFVVEGESMHPTFQSGDYLIVDQLSYRFEEPERGDVVVFRYPNNPSVFYIKRVVGLPGETVSIERGKVSITKADGSTLVLDEPYVIAEDATYTKDAIIGKDEYFVMGDNRPQSSDSRIWGTLPKDDLMGRAFVRLLPVAQASVLPGDVTQPQ